MRPLKILTWHIHGSYLYYLSHIPHELYVPWKPERPAGYTGTRGHFPWPATLREIPAEELRRQSFDCILFQWREHYFKDQYELLSPEQQRLPKIYLEHDPPQEHPTFARHPVQDPNALLVHVTAFNELMWDNGITPTRVIEHGVRVPESVRYSGEIPRGLSVINHLKRRGRRLGSDVFERLRDRVPLDLVGMAAEESGGIGEVRHDLLPDFQARYRFFFNPIRYTSLGLAVCEAMMTGMPIVGLATTEMATAIRNDVSGFVDTRLDVLEDVMKELLRNPGLAAEWGRHAREEALRRFSIPRFVRDWNDALASVAGRRPDAMVPVEAVPC